MSALPTLGMANVAAGYGGCEIFRQISASIAPGEILGLLGQNGCGKTTLLRCAAGHLRPLAGKIDLHGKPLRACSRQARARAIASFAIGQQRPHAFQLGQYVLLGRFPWLNWPGFYSAHDRQMATAALNALGIGQLADMPLAALSAGQWQMAGLARALAQIWDAQRPLLLLDEPGATLDLRSHMAFARLLASLRRKGWAIMMAAHDCNMAALACTHLLGIKNGKCLFCGPVNQVFTEENLSELYDWPVGVYAHPDLGLPQIYIRPVPGMSGAGGPACPGRGADLR